MAAEKADVLLIGPPKPVIVNGLAGAFNIVKLPDANERDKFFAESGPRVRGMAVAATEERVDGPFMTRFPRLEIVSSFGVGYDHVDAAWAGGARIEVTVPPGPDFWAPLGLDGPVPLPDAAALQQPLAAG